MVKVVVKAKVTIGMLSKRHLYPWLTYGYEDCDAATYSDYLFVPQISFFSIIVLTHASAIIHFHSNRDNKTTLDETTRCYHVAHSMSRTKATFQKSVGHFISE